MTALTWDGTGGKQIQRAGIDGWHYGYRRTLVCCPIEIVDLNHTAAHTKIGKAHAYIRTDIRAPQRWLGGRLLGIRSGALKSWN